MNNRVKELIDLYEMLPHPEGGYYKETYRSKGIIQQSALPTTYSDDRHYSTAIYFLITNDNFSAFHRILQDELWHFYEGDPLTVYQISEKGNYNAHKIGSEISKGQNRQLLVPGGDWFASAIDPADQHPNAYAFVGCTVAPGFDFNDFELAQREELTNLYPEHKSVIERLTRE